MFRSPPPLPRLSDNTELTSRVCSNSYICSDWTWASAERYATRLSGGGVADEWVTQLLRQGDAKVFKKYSQMKLQMKREALEKMRR
jgi:hypothetical protein